MSDISSVPSQPSQPSPVPLSKVERRKAQNRRAQANLRRKRREQIESLRQQIDWFESQDTSKTVAQDGDYQQMTRVLDQLSWGSAINNSLLCIQNNNFPNIVTSNTSLQNPGKDNPLDSSHSAMTVSDEHYANNNILFLSDPDPGVDMPLDAALPKDQIHKSIQCELQFCAFDALTTNAKILNISSECFLSTHSESPFYTPFRTTILNLLHLPANLRPTVAQTSYPHQPWIDCIPLAEFRSRAILAASHQPPLIDTLDLWHDVLLNGLSCFGNPEDFAAWKMSEDFAKRWQMLLTMDLNTLEAMCLATNPPILTMNLCNT